MSAPATLPWLARHEISLTWRDFVMMMTAGHPRRRYLAFAIVLAALAVLHLIAWTILQPTIQQPGGDPIARLTIVTGMIALAFSLMGSQAMESVTRVFYTRSDMDLILSSPVSTRRIFAVRIGAVVLSTSILSVLLAAPAINVLAIFESPRWLLGYAFIVILGALATVLAVVLALALFRTVGARRTRTIAQFAAALIGAMFIIGVQIAAIASIGTISRMNFLRSEAVKTLMPGSDSPLWIPARAAMGELPLLIVLAMLAAGAFLTVVYLYSDMLAEKVIAAAGISESRSHSRRRDAFRRYRSVQSALRRKEWRLLARDHWLISQTLMQILYLAPPAFLLWRSFGQGSAIPTVIVPVLVMAAGQLAGGLAWLAISGEDAPQLVATAPIRRSAVIRAKAEAVLVVVAVIFAPLVAALATFDIGLALVCTIAMVLACLSATAIQLWFRSQARRSDFRRRQTSSRVATIAEALSSILWAGSAAIWASGSMFALVFAGIAIVILFVAWFISPGHDNAL